MIRLERLVAIRLVSHDAAALASFYSAALGFERGPVTPVAAEELAALGLAGTGTRTSLSLSGQVLEIDQFDPPGQPYPQPWASDDRHFQHFAVITPYLPGAWARVLAAGASPVSPDGPVQLPPENGNVRAVKFRDPEGHPLELLSFPAPSSDDGLLRCARNDETRRAISGSVIDHSAIVVRDVAASIAFYQARGLAVGQRTLNHGAAQAALDGLVEPRVDVVQLHPPGPGAHLELLGYRDPGVGPPLPWQVRDVAATRLVWQSDQAGLVTDPDGHLHQCQPPGRPDASPPANG
jgi:catechol 2,3-dioxygenase-like lactoylglutathione lyase family enzyme